MKLIHYIYKNNEEIGILTEDDYIKPLDVKNFDELISSYTLNDLKIKDSLLKKSIKRDEITPLAFINNPKSDVICAGMNYLSHKEECIKEGVITNGDIINRHSDITNECDYEGELAVILYKDLYKGNKDEVYDSIFGYVIMNDVSARDLQRSHQQFYYAKSLDTYTVMSEVLVTKDTFDDYPKLNLKTYINDELRQNSNTSLMIYSIYDMLYELSLGITLKRGTILSTGTPNGVGMGMNPKKFLNNGDIIRIEIEDIGILQNKCI